MKRIYEQDRGSHKRSAFVDAYAGSADFPNETVAVIAVEGYPDILMTKDQAIRFATSILEAAQGLCCTNLEINVVPISEFPQE